MGPNNNLATIIERVKGQFLESPPIRTESVGCLGACVRVERRHSDAQKPQTRGKGILLARLTLHPVRQAL